MADLFREVLLAADFEGVSFPVERESAEFGNDIVEHTARGRDGADLEPTGWRARRGTLVAVFVNGVEGQADLFPRRYTDLVAAIKAHPIGSFVHPVDGLMTAALKTGKRETSGDVRGGCRVTLEWVEHNATASSLATFSGAPATDAAASAVARADAADDAMAAADPDATYVPTGTAVRNGLAYLESAPRTYGDVVGTLRGLDALATSNAALPAFATVDGYAAVAALADLRAAVVALRSRYLPEQSRVRTYRPDRTMADWQVAQAVYGDARKAALVRAGNGWLDYSAIPAGTELVILPAD